MIYKVNPDEALAINEGTSFADSNFGKAVIKIFMKVRDMISAVWKFIKKLFAEPDDKIPPVVKPAEDVSQTTNDPETKSATVNSNIVYHESKHLIRIDFGPMYDKGPRGFSQLTNGLLDVVNQFKQLLNMERMSKSALKTTFDVMTNAVASLIGSETNPITWKKAIVAYCGDPRTEESVYISDIIDMPCFAVCKDKATFEETKKEMDACIKGLDKCCVTIIDAVKERKPEKCRNGFQPKYNNDTRDYGDVDPMNFGNAMYDIATGLESITTQLCISLKVYARSAKYVYKQYDYIKQAMANGTVVKENSTFADAYAFVGLIK